MYKHNFLSVFDMLHFFNLTNFGSGFYLFIFCFNYLFLNVTRILALQRLCLFFMANEPNFPFGT